MTDYELLKRAVEAEQAAERDTAVDMLKRRVATQHVDQNIVAAMQRLNTEDDLDTRRSVLRGLNVPGVQE